MKSLYQFIIKPYEDRYNNKIQVDDKELIVNTSIEDHKFVSKKAVVVSTPAAFDTDMKGREKNSSTFFKDELYFCGLDQIYMYDNKCHLNYCFIKPIKEINDIYNRKEKEYFGILKYSNKSLEAVGLRSRRIKTWSACGIYSQLRV